MKERKTSRKGSENMRTGITERTSVLRRSKGSLTAAVLAFVLAISFFIPMTSGVASATVTGSETDIMWADNLGGDGWDYFYGVAAAPDGGFVAVGYMSSSTLANYDGSFNLAGNNTLIVKYDAAGNIEWADTLGGDNYDCFYGVTTAPDGGFVAVGTMYSTTLSNYDGSFSLGLIGTGGSDTLIVKYDANGNIVWGDNLGGDSSNVFYGVTTAPDGGFVAAGSMCSSTMANYDSSFRLERIGAFNNTLIVKYDAAGNIVWGDNLGGNGEDYFEGVAAAPDGGFVAVGYFTSTVLANYDGSFSLAKMGTRNNTLIVKYDAAGNIVWGDNLGGDNNNYFYGVTTAPDGGFVAAGCMSSSTLANYDSSFRLERIGAYNNTLIVKYDAAGSIEWADNLGGDDYDYFLGIAATPDGGFAAVGYFYSTTLANQDGSFSLTRLGAGQDTLIVKYTRAPPEFTVTVTGGNIVSWSPVRIIYGDSNVEITFVAEPGYHVDSIVSVFMGSEKLTEGTDYAFEDGALKILRHVTGDLCIEVTTAPGTEVGTDLWWVLIASLTVLSLLLLLGFVYKRRKEDQEA